MARDDLRDLTARSLRVGRERVAAVGVVLDQLDQVAADRVERVIARAHRDAGFVIHVVQRVAGQRHTALHCTGASVDRRLLTDAGYGFSMSSIR